MNTEKVNALRQMVRAEMVLAGEQRNWASKSYWRGVYEMLFIVIQLNFLADKSSASDLLTKLRSNIYTDDHYGSSTKHSKDDCA